MKQQPTPPWNHHHFRPLLFLYLNEQLTIEPLKAVKTVAASGFSLFTSLPPILRFSIHTRAHAPHAATSQCFVQENRNWVFSFNHNLLCDVIPFYHFYSFWRRGLRRLPATAKHHWLPTIRWRITRMCMLSVARTSPTPSPLSPTTFRRNCLTVGQTTTPLGKTSAMKSTSTTTPQNPATNSCTALPSNVWMKTPLPSSTFVWVNKTSKPPTRWNAALMVAKVSRLCWAKAMCHPPTSDLVQLVVLRAWTLLTLHWCRKQWWPAALAKPCSVDPLTIPSLWIWAVFLTLATCHVKVVKKSAMASVWPTYTALPFKFQLLHCSRRVLLPSHVTFWTQTMWLGFGLQQAVAPCVPWKQMVLPLPKKVNGFRYLVWVCHWPTKQ